MGKIKLTREIREEIKKIAGKIPAILGVKKASYLWKGSDLLLTPIKADPETGEPIQKDKYYHITGPGFLEMDHASEMEKAFQIGGVRAVNKYVLDLASAENQTFTLNTPV